MLTKTVCNDIDCQACRWNDSSEHTGTTQQLISHQYLSYGDYDNSCAVERANVRYLGEQHLIEQRETGSYGFTQAWLLDTEANRELLAGLDDYPVLDDELVSVIEQEIEDEYIADNNDIYRLYTPEPLRSILDELDMHNLIPETYYQAKEEDNEQFIVEAGGNGYIDLQRIAPTYNRLLLAANPAIQLLVNRTPTAATRPVFPFSFYDSAADMLHARAGQYSNGYLIDQDEARSLLQYTAELEALLDSITD